MAKKKTTKKKVVMKKQSRNLLHIVVALVILLGLGFMIYSVITYQNSEQEKEGFFACNSEGTVCELSQHIHAEIDMTVCGEEIIFEKEKGHMNEQHTHKEVNLMHWHARLQVDPLTREPLDPTRRQVRAFLEQMEFTFPESCPNNNTPTLSVLVNDEENEQGLDYVWQDGDTITIVYE